MSARTAGKILVILLRFLGTNAILAFVFVLMPFSRIQQLHEKTGLGELPDIPIVGYLSRSLCLFYTVFGIILWTVSFDLDNCRRLLWRIGVILPAIGCTLLAIDFYQGLPLVWTLSEGPFTIITGGLFLWLLRARYRTQR